MARPFKYIQLTLSLDDQECYTPADIAEKAAEQGLDRHAVGVTFNTRTRKIKARWGDIGPDGHRPGAFLGIRWKSILPVSAFKNRMEYEELQSRVKALEADDQEPVTLPRQQSVGKKQFPQMAWLLIAAAVLLIFSVTRTVDVDPLDRIERNKDNEQALRDLLLQPDFESLRSVIIATIAANQAKVVPIYDNADAIMAVFAFEVNPCVVMQDGQMLRPGDHVTIGYDAGYITEIQQAQILLETGRGMAVVEIPSDPVFGLELVSSFPVTLRPSDQNADTLIRVAAEALQLDWQGNALQANLVGYMDVPDFNAFLEEVTPHLGLSLHGNTLQLREDHLLRGYIGFTDDWRGLRTGRLSRMFSLYGEALGWSISFEGDDEQVAFAPVQLARVIEDLHLDLQTWPEQRIAIIRQ